MRFKMKAVSCHFPGELKFEDFPAPGPPREGWVLVQVSHVGICNADYRLFAGDLPSVAYPRVMGQEVSGTVMMTGAGVSLTVGQEVIVNPNVACGKCLDCLKGKPNCCAHIEILGVHRDGGLCERMLVPAANLYPTSGLSLADAAAVPFLTVGAHAVRQALVGAGGRAVVIGAGSIGLGAALFARIAGHDVVIADHHRDRLHFATNRLGLAVIDGPEAPSLDSASYGGFDIVFDATGDDSCITIASNQATLGRRLRTVVSADAQRCDYDHVSASISSGVIPVSKLVTHKATLDEAPGSIAHWSQDKSHVIKAVVSVAYFDDRCRRFVDSDGQYVIKRK